MVTATGCGTAKAPGEEGAWLGTGGVVAVVVVVEDR